MTVNQLFRCPCYISNDGSHTQWTGSLFGTTPHAAPLCSTTMQMTDPPLNPHLTPTQPRQANTT